MSKYALSHEIDRQSFTEVTCYCDTDSDIDKDKTYDECVTVGVVCTFDKIWLFGLSRVCLAYYLYNSSSSSRLVVDFVIALVLSQRTCFFYYATHATL